MRGGPGSATNAVSLIRHGLGFVMSCPPGAGVMKTMVNEFRRCPELQTETVGGTEYTVMERKLGLLSVDGRWRFVLDDDPAYGRCAMTVHATACMNTDVNKEFRKVLREKVSATAESIDGECPDDPDEFFAYRSAAVSRFLDYSVDGGRISVHVDRAAVRSAESEAGMFVLVTSEPGWEKPLSMMWDGVRALGGLDMMRTEYGAALFKRNGAGGGARRAFLQFLAMCIRSSIDRRLRDLDGDRMSVDLALHRAASYKAVEYGGMTFRTHVGHDTEAILRHFSIDVSESP